MKDKDKEGFDSITLPNLKHLPKLASSFMEEIASVQPMPENVGEVFTSHVITTKTIQPEFGDKIHNFVYGWQIYDGSEFVSLEEFLERFSKEQIKPWREE